MKKILLTVCLLAHNVGWLFAQADSLLAHWNFSGEYISHSEGSIIVKDATANELTGILMNDASIRTIGGSENGQINVLDLGNGSGYFDMGTTIGEYIYQLSDYTMCAYFRIDDENTSLNSAGNFIYTFSNSDDINQGMNGYIIGNLTDQSHSIAKTNWRNNQNVCRNQKAAKGKWHHYAFTQKGNTGTLYVDGKQVKQNTAMNYLPKNILPISGRTGTLYNWLGRSPYASDGFLTKTLLYDFKLFDVALTATDFVSIDSTLQRLNAAYNENSDALPTILTEEYNELTLEGLEIVTSDLSLPTVGSLSQDVRIEWISSHPYILSTDGKVNRLTNADAHICLIAKLTYGGQSITKEFLAYIPATKTNEREKPRVIVTTDGEDDDKASMVRFLLTANEFDVEAIINSSSQFHWVGGKGWNAFKPVGWIRDYVELYREVYDNLCKHDVHYPSPDYLIHRWKVGNVDGIGEYNKRTEGAELIANILLDERDSRPIWFQAWGGCNTLARALKIIEEEYPEKMEQVASKLRLYLIWEQDETYQQYIRGSWEKYNIPTIISDQFDCIAYIWPKVLPAKVQPYFQAEWMTENILSKDNPLCKIYTQNKGAYNAEGDSPSFLHCIPNGLRSMESPEYGGWGGRYVKVRNNVYMDTPPSDNYIHPTGQYGFSNSWSKMMENWKTDTQVEIRTNYFKPTWRWIPDFQNDFAARTDWCTATYEEANHHPIAILKDSLFNIKACRGESVTLDASQSYDPDEDELTFKWYCYSEASTYKGKIPEKEEAKIQVGVPEDAVPGNTIHYICEVSDNGKPSLKKYLRVIITVEESSTLHEITQKDDFSVIPVKGGIKVMDKRLVVTDLVGKIYSISSDGHVALERGIYILKSDNNLAQKILVDSTK